MKKKLFSFILLFFLSDSLFGQVAFDLPGQIVIDIGFSNWGKHPDNLGINVLESRTANISYLYDLPIFGEKFTFNPGLSLGIDGYIFKEDVTLTYQPEELLVVSAIDAYRAMEIRKSKLATNYLDVPLEFRFRTNPGRNSFRLGLGGKAGMLLSSHTKVKFEDEFGDLRRVKNKGEYNLAKFRYGITGRIGFGSFNFFAYYGLNEVFESKAIRQAEENPRTFTFGLSIQGL